MKQTIYLKNMVCNRCKDTVVRELEELGYAISSVELGQIVLHEEVAIDHAKLRNILEQHGFEIIEDESEVLIEEIKIALINNIEYLGNENLSSILAKRFNKSYSILSKLFSKSEGMTIEKYEINLKLEKVKELIQLGRLNFSEIAYMLGYGSSSHLARQFKMSTGLSMTEYKSLKVWDRKSLDRIV